MGFPTTQKSDLAPHRSQSQFSVSYWVPFLTLFTVNGLSVALLIRSLVLCNQVLSELRRVHFTGSQGTRSNQNVVFPPSAITPPLLFATAVQSSTLREKLEPENKQTQNTDGEWNQRGVSEPGDSFLPFFLFVYLCQLHWNGSGFALLLSNKFATLEQVFFVFFHVLNISHNRTSIKIQLKDKALIKLEKWVSIFQIIARYKNFWLPFLFPTLTRNIQVIFSTSVVPYLFMCATEGQAFDDLFVIIFISSQEKF